VQVVVVSTAGAGSAPHWSHAFAGTLADAFVARGADVTWLAGVAAGEDVTAAAVQPQPFARRVLPLPFVARNHVDTVLELALTEHLRRHPRAPVVHAGLGAGGSPNVLWLCDRLGSPVFACARGAELACARGDLVDRDGEACRESDDPERCRWCCRTTWRRRPHVTELQNRTDLIVAGLVVAERVFVERPEDRPLVVGLGVPDRRVDVGMRPEHVVASVLGDAVAAGD